MICSAGNLSAGQNAPRLFDWSESWESNPYGRYSLPAPRALYPLLIPVRTAHFCPFLGLHAHDYVVWNKNEVLLSFYELDPDRDRDFVCCELRIPVQPELCWIQP